MACLSTMAAACLLVVLLMLVTQPHWETPILGVPLGAFLLGGLGGLITLGCIPSWSRRVGPEPRRVVAFTLYRLASAFVMGGVGFAGAAALAAGSLDPDGWIFLAIPLGSGIVEKPLNDGLLTVLGLVASPESDSRMI